MFALIVLSGAMVSQAHVTSVCTAARLSSRGLKA
jgi:hypothetical protein